MPFVYQVGKPYNPGRRNWPEIAQYQFRGGEHELLLFLGAPTGTEVQSVRSGRASFGLYANDGLVIMLYRFEPALPWSDAPYNFHLVTAEQRLLPPTERAPGERVLLTVLLVDANSGILRAIRQVGLESEFVRRLELAIHRQASAPFVTTRYEQVLAQTFERYMPEELARHQLTIHSIGGQP